MDQGEVPSVKGKTIESVEHWMSNMLVHFTDGTSVQFKADIGHNVNMVPYKDNSSEDPKVKYLVSMKNADQYCNYCRKCTPTKIWDCTVCNFSKPYPAGF